jgi:kinesin family protein C2/C3
MLPAAQHPPEFTSVTISRCMHRCLHPCLRLVTPHIPTPAPRKLENMRDTCTLYVSPLAVALAVRDLLSEPHAGHAKKHDILRHPSLGMYVRDLTTSQVLNAAAAEALISAGHQHRSVGVTNLNEQSSRSHMLLTLTVLTTNLRTGEKHVGKLSLVDLAGSERLSKIDTTGQALKETQAINKSLSALGSVLNGLARKEGHVPYRDSKLTYLLQDSLGGNAKTLMMVTCGPTRESSAETVSSLTFASRAKAVTMGPAKANRAPESKEAALKEFRPSNRAAPPRT